MAKTGIEMENNKIGSAIQYFRESCCISQGKLCKGLCSVATLSRIEAGERDVDTLLLETLLERLGRVPNHFELILTDLDYVLYQNREEIKKQIKERNYEEAYQLLNHYEKLASAKGNVHMQFITSSKAFLNELKGNSIETTIDLLKEAITYTVPNFSTKQIQHNYLSNSELNIIIDLIQRMISAEMTVQAKDLLIQVLEYFDWHVSNEENNHLYPKVAAIASRFFMEEKNLNRAIDMSKKGLEKSKGSRKMDFLGDLFYLQGQITEELLKAKKLWDNNNKECLKLYLQAYYIYEFCNETVAADIIKKYLQEEYQWVDID